MFINGLMVLEEVLRVLHVVKKLPPLVGGDATAVAALARAQRAVGIDVRLAAYNSDADMGSDVVRIGPLQSRHGLDRITVRRIRGMAALRKWARRALTTERVDVVHAHAADLGFAIGSVARSLNIRTVLTCHGVWFASLPRWSPRGRIEKLLIRLSRASAVTSVDSTSVAALRGAGIASARLVPNGVDVGEFADKPPRSGPFRFLFAGRHENQKGLDILLRAIAQSRTGAEFVVDIVGEGSLTNRLRSQARALGVGNVARFPGVLSRSDLVRAFVTSDALVLPSRSEGLPMAILEAWSARLAVIATRVGGVLDVCTPENAVLIPSEDPNALAQAMLTLVRDPARRQTLAENGHNLVRTRFTWPAIANAYIDVYEGKG